MPAVLAYSERAKSHLLYQEAAADATVDYILATKSHNVDGAEVLSAKVIKAPPNFVYSCTAVAKFETALGFVKFSHGLFLIAVEKSRLVAEISSQRIFKILSARGFEVSRAPAEGQPDVTSTCHELKSMLDYFNSGVFYYAERSDIAQNSQTKNCSPDMQAERQASFIWNQHLLKPVIELASQVPLEQRTFLEQSGLFVKVSKGYFGSNTVELPSGIYQIAVFTRLGQKKAGTRFNARGLDDEGNASIFGETELILQSQGLLFSYLILRGSVPVFWEQQGVQIGAPRVQISRAPLATQPSFDRHFERLVEHYSLVHIINLLSSKEGSVELLLTDAYEYHLNHCTLVDQLAITSFDLNKHASTGTKAALDALFQHISRDIQVFGYHAVFDEQKSQKTQRGIFRVNCFDCLDRTNLVQDFIARKVVDLFFRNCLFGQNIKQIDSLRIQSTVSGLFADNGDSVSRVYAGTSALRSAHTRNGRSGLFDYLDDAKKSIVRMYCGHFTDKAKQSSLDFILGNRSDAVAVELYNPISKTVQAQLQLKKAQYTTYKKLSLAAITWNTGGTLASSFSDHFADFKNFFSHEADLFIVCLQEIVQLSATQIVSSDPEKRVLWDTAFASMFDDYFGPGKFVQLVSNQLVGTSLTLFVRTTLVDEIKNVEVSSIKTGLGGIAGNKGSIGVRFEYLDGTFCIVGSHFTAGQTAASERVKEYSSVLQDLSFSKGKRILPSDIVVWLGDFNFRSDTDSPSAKELAKSGNYEALLAFDQILALRKSTKLFESFQEMPINFAPSYKYDPGTNTYDTSEKNRVPSWTDRIMFHGKKLVGCLYSRCEVDVSDHRPVFLIAETELEICDKIVFQKLEQELFAKHSVEEFDSPELPPRPILC